MNIIQEFDTITAAATPAGNGGVGVIRISGDKSFDIIYKIFTKKNLSAGKIAHGNIVDNDTIIDEVIVLPFKKPHSFTGEDVIEIHCHGGMQVVKNVIDTVLKNGARMAQRGEFTKRAFLNKKLDLTQAEAVADLIHSKTSDFAKLSVRNLSGVLGCEIHSIRKEIFDVLSKIIAGTDFPEDVDEPEYEYLTSEFEKIIARIDKILSFAHSSDIMRQGIKIAVTGRPNVGKSSLFNALLNVDRAIVTDIAGTTRDVLTETLDWDVPITLIDTAGIRQGKDVGKIEEIGIEFSKQSAENADLVLFLYDASVGMTQQDKSILKLIINKPHIVIANKSDLTNKKDDDKLYISALYREGLDELKKQIKNKVLNFSSENMEFVTNQRQEDCLQKSKESLILALDASKRHELQDLISIDLKNALLYLDELTGEVVTDEILNNIFDNFCIGK